MNKIPPAALSTCLLFASLPAQELLTNGSFETGSVPCDVQGSLPAPWFTAGGSLPGAATYSFDCGSLGGFAPTTFSNFTTLPTAADGLRFVGCAGWSNGNGEKIGSPLSQSTVVGSRYELTAALTRSDRNAAAGRFEIYLSPTDDIQDGTLVGQLDTTGVPVGSWSEVSLTFDAPIAGSFLILDPVTVDFFGLAYLGIDRISLTGDAGQQAVVESVDAGCPAPGSNLELVATPPILGETVDFGLQGLPPAVTTTVLIAPGEPAAAPIPGTPCALWLDMAQTRLLVAGVSNGIGNLLGSLEIPDDTRLLGMPFGMVGAHEALNGPIYGVAAVSNTLRLVIGAQ